MVVVAEGTCMVRLLQVLVRFYHHESCGQCTPCREGMGWLHKIVDRIVAGKGELDDIERLIAISEANDGTTICGMGDAAGYATVGILAKYRDEFEHWIVHARSRCEGRLEAMGAEWTVPEAALHG
jgi:NADH-quinone oxidoreductase subunit F